MKTKTCPKCKNTKALSHFPKDKSKEDGRGGTCKVCKREEYARKREEREMTPVHPAIPEFLKRKIAA